MAVHLKYTDDHAIIDVEMTPPSTSPTISFTNITTGKSHSNFKNSNIPIPTKERKPSVPNSKVHSEEIGPPNFDTINKRFSKTYKIFGGKYDTYCNTDEDSAKSDTCIKDGGGGSDTEAGKIVENTSLFRSRYNSIEEELANTPYAFTTDRFALSSNNAELNLENKIESPSKDIEDDSYFSSNRSLVLQTEDSLFGPSIDFEILSKSNSDEEPPSFSVTQLIHAQNRYCDLSDSKKTSLRKFTDNNIDKPSDSDKGSVQKTITSAIVRTSPSVLTKVKFGFLDSSDSIKDADSFKVLPVRKENIIPSQSALPTSKRKKETSFAIVTSSPVTSKPPSPRDSPWKVRATLSRTESPEPVINRSSKTSSPEHRKATRRENLEYSKSSREQSPEQRLPTNYPNLPRRSSRPVTPEQRRPSRQRSPEYKIPSREGSLEYRRVNRSPDRRIGTRSVSPHEGKYSRQRSPEYTIPSRDESPEYERIGSINTSPRKSKHASPEARRSYSQTRVKELKQALEQEKMATAIQPVANYSRPVTPRNFIKSNIKEVHELSEMNREKHEAEEDRLRREEEEHILREMGVISTRTSRCSSPICKYRDRSMSPVKISLRSRSNSPSAILHYQKIDENSNDFLEMDNKPISHKSRLRNLSKSQPQSKTGSPKHGTRIPQRNGSVSPTRSGKTTPRKVTNNLNSKRFMSNSTSKINETVANRRASDKKNNNLSKSTQQLNIAPGILKSKPPVPNKVGPPPANKNLNSKRLSPIVGTPNKSSSDSEKSPKPTLSTLSSAVRMANKATGKPLVKSLTKPTNNDKKETSPDKEDTTSMKRSDSKSKDSRKETPKTSPTKSTDPKNSIKRTPSNSNLAKNSSKPDFKRVVSKANNISSLSKSLSAKGLVKSKDELNKSNSKTETITNENKNDGETEKSKDIEKIKTGTNGEKIEPPQQEVKKLLKRMSSEGIVTKDMGIQLDKLSINGKSENLVPLTRKNVVSMTTAAITSQPLDVVTTLTNNLPGASDRNLLRKTDSDDSIVIKSDQKAKKMLLEKKSSEPLLPKAVDNTKITETINRVEKEVRNIETKTDKLLDNIVTETKNEVKTTMEEITITEITKITDDIKKLSDFKAEAKTIVDSILTPVETPAIKLKVEPKKVIDPVITVVNERKDVVKTNEKLVKGGKDAEVESSNTAGIKMADDVSNTSNISNGRWPKGASGTAQNGMDVSPKPSISLTSPPTPDDLTYENEKKSRLCERLTCGLCRRCRSKSGKMEDSDSSMTATGRKMSSARQPGELDLHLLKAEGMLEGQKGFFQKLCSCCGGDGQKPSRLAAICCCRRMNRVGDSASTLMQDDRSGCFSCCRRYDPNMRRDSILSDRPRRWWECFPCCRRPEMITSRRPSMYSKNKSLSPPPEDTRPKLDPTLVEHNSLMRAAIPVLPKSLAYLCLVCNILIPGFGTILSGIFCLCFGKPRFSVHDGMKQRLGSFVINLCVGIGQLFTVLFCLVGWGWSVWWGVKMVSLSKKQIKIKEHEKLAAENEPPVTANNHRP